MAGTPSFTLRLLLVVGAGLCLVPLVAEAPPLLLERAGWVGLLVFARWARMHIGLYATLSGVAFVCLVLVLRLLLKAWFNYVRPRIAGAYEAPESSRFPRKTVELLSEVRALEKDKSQSQFVTLGRLSQSVHVKATPCLLSEVQRTKHVKVIGHIGSGKTKSVMFPMILQDVRKGKGMLIIEPKGSDENINIITNIAHSAGRLKDLRIVSLPFPERGHTYNPIWLEPRSKANPQGGDPLAVAERVFSVLRADMENPFYRSQAEAFFRNLIRVLHGVLDEHGTSIPFSLRDALYCIQNRDVLLHVLARTSDVDAVHDIKVQLKALADARQTGAFSGLQVLLETFVAPILNSYAPDVTMEQALEDNLIVYFQLPGNYYAKVAQAVGKFVLQDLQQCGAMRQLHRKKRNQRHFSVFIDECYHYAYDGLVASLNQLRDANIQFTILFQAMSDLERVDVPFAKGITENTLTTVLLHQDDAAVCEQIAKSLGTKQTYKTTRRMSVGPLATKLNSGEESERLVEEFRLPPNRIKHLAPQGQGLVIHAGECLAVNFAMLPSTFERDPAPGVSLVAQRAPVAGLNLRALALSGTA